MIYKPSSPGSLSINLSLIKKPIHQDALPLAHSQTETYSSFDFSLFNSAQLCTTRTVSEKALLARDSLEGQSLL